MHPLWIISSLWRRLFAHAKPVHKSEERKTTESFILLKKKKIQLTMLPRSKGVTEPSRDYYSQFLTFDFHLTIHLYNLNEWKQQA